jgi:signal transduction histidine kinase/CheY-like chemotaxis protein
VIVEKVVLLAPDSSRSAELTQVLRQGAGALAENVLVETAQGAAASAVARARVTCGSLPLAVVVESDADAVEALAAGADEAMVLPSPDTNGLLVLVERARGRAMQRIAHTSERDSTAHAEKLAALGTVVAGVAHEINNPLAAVLLAVDALRLVIRPVLDASEELQRLATAGKGLTPAEVERLAAKARNSIDLDEARELLDETASHVQVVADIVRDLRIYARADDEEAPQLVHIPNLIDQVLRVVGGEIAVRGHIERDYAASLPLLALPHSRIVQVVTNVLLNAAHAIAEVQRPVHRVRISVRADQEFLAISVSDTGPGIAPDALERIFDPFYTTRRGGGGSGLGLSISRAILRRLGGDLLAESVHGQGATFVALIPLPDAEQLRAAHHRPAGECAPALAHRRATVLVVEPDERLLRNYPRILRDQFDIILSADGQEAIDLLSSGSVADAVLTELALPEVDGRRFFSWLEEYQPELARRTIFVTDGAQDEYSDFLARVGNRVIVKPATRAQLLQALVDTLR